MNSENNGPYGDAIMQGADPGDRRRSSASIREPWARMLSGGSTGGWIAAAHQVFYPGLLRRLVRQLPGLGGLPLSPDRRHLQGRQRLLHRQGLDEGRAAQPAPARRQHRVDDEGRELVTSWSSATSRARAASGTSGRRPTRRSAPTAIPGGSGTRRPASIDKPSPRQWKKYDLRAHPRDQLDDARSEDRRTS